MSKCDGCGEKKEGHELFVDSDLYDCNDPPYYCESCWSLPETPEGRGFILEGYIERHKVARRVQKALEEEIKRIRGYVRWCEDCEDAPMMNGRSVCDTCFAHRQAIREQEKGAP